MKTHRGEKTEECNQCDYASPYVSNFITEFDNGKIPELIDEDTVIEMMGECEAYQVLNVGKGCGCEYCGNYGEEC